MTVFLTATLLLAMASVLGALLLGLFSMMKGGEFNQKYGNRLMQARVVLQAVSLLLLALAFMSTKTHQ